MSLQVLILLGLRRCVIWLVLKCVAFLVSSSKIPTADVFDDYDGDSDDDELFLWYGWPTKGF